jgi:magnesium chelatase accessory protein
MSRRLLWTTDGAQWPLRESSRFVDAAGMRWHVQQMGHGPALLLLHGTGSSTHSWRDLAPLLAREFQVIAPDLPGHAFSDGLPADRRSLPGMAAAIGELMRALSLQPDVVFGHSAGAALMLRMALDGAVRPRALIGINAALLPFGGWAGFLYAPMARLLARNPLVPWLASWRAQDAAAVRRLIGSTGSTLDERGVALYATLMRSPAHVAGVLAMMANWDLDRLQRDLPALQAPLHLAVGLADTTVAPSQARQVARWVPRTTVHTLEGCGHLAHEEAPAAVADIVRRAIHASSDAPVEG